MLLLQGFIGFILLKVLVKTILRYSHPGNNHLENRPSPILEAHPIFREFQSRVPPSTCWILICFFYHAQQHSINKRFAYSQILWNHSHQANTSLSQVHLLKGRIISISSCISFLFHEPPPITYEPRHSRWTPMHKPWPRSTKSFFSWRKRETFSLWGQDMWRHSY